MSEHPKGFDQVLWAAFSAGAFEGNRIHDQKSCEEAFNEWRRRFAGLEDADTESLGAEVAVVSEQGSDTGGEETSTGAEAAICTCPHPKALSPENHKHYPGCPYLKVIFEKRSQTTSRRQGGSEAGCYS